MRYQRLSVLFALAGLIGGCSTMKIRSDYDRKASFSGLKSFAWTPRAQEPTGDPRIDNSIVDERIRRAVEGELTRRGFVKRESGTPDFYIGYHAAIERKLNVSVMHDYYGYGSGFGHYPERFDPHVKTYASEYDEGTLVLDIANPSTMKLLWRGSAQTALMGSTSPQHKEQRVKEAVRRILDRFPPS